ncbi:DUF4407 domain-containing protein [Dactylosporangium sp. CA-139114]|uniref:DUF4407 domain-containing protein n=1 Tax=Dactylosporangium sp. CA-139114 TaxID=3239931 RepID=UPI003D9651E3
MTFPPAPEAPTIPQPRTADDDTARTVRFSAIAGRPEPEALPGRFNVGRLLRRCGGVSEVLLAWVPVERARYTGLGGSVLFTALMAIASMTMALTIAFNQRWYLLLPAALFWGVVVFNLDRWIAATPLPKRGLVRVLAFAPRFLIAFVFALVIAEPVLLIVFKSEVADQIVQLRAGEQADYRKKLDECNPRPPAEADESPKCKGATFTQLNEITPAADAQSRAKDDADAAARQLAKAQTAMDDAELRYTNECSGKNGSPHGNGPVCQALKVPYDNARADRDTRSSENKRKNEALTAAGAALEAAQQRMEKARTDKIDDLVRAHERGGDRGLLERIEALNSISLEHLALFVAIWAVRILLVTIDTIPALLKLTMGATKYDELAREEARLGAQKHRARAMVEEDAAQSWVDESEEHAEIGRAERRHERDRAADALLLEAARHRDAQAAQFRPVVDDDHVPFGRAQYLMVSRTEAAGPAKRRPPVVEPGRGGPPDDPAHPNAPAGAESFGRTLGPLPSISVVALGGPGSGKTTFLAQMYDQLRRPDPTRPYTLTLSDGGPRTHLENWADTIRGPGSEWPPTTTTEHLVQYQFTCRVEEHTVHQPILTVDYWDYSGEALLQNTELPGIDELRKQLSAKIIKADALLIIVDGEDLRRAGDGDAVAARRLERVLTKIEAYAEPVQCPAQIVVTKWDELANRPHPSGGVWDRARIIEALFALDPVRAIAVGRTFRAGSAYGVEGMRVIPLSVVGGAGSTQRLADAPTRVLAADPVNVDVPFAGLLPDRLDQIYAGKGSEALAKQLRAARGRLAWVLARGIARLGLLVARVLPLFGVANAITKIAEIDLSGWVPSYLVDKLDLAGQRSKEDVRLLRQAKLLRDSATAIDRVRYKVMAAFGERLARFDREFPPSGWPLDRGGLAVFNSPGDERDERFFV